MRNDLNKLTPVEKMRERGESIIRVANGLTFRRRVHDVDSEPWVQAHNYRMPVRRLDPPARSRSGLPIEWGEVPA